MSSSYKKILKSVIFSVFMIFSFESAFALDVPALKGRVNDYAGIIGERTENEIEEYLSSLEEQSGVQIAVLTVPSLEGENIAGFGIKVAEKWQLGEKGKDNGAVLIVAMQEHDLRIEVGDGLEGVLTDAKCGLIIRNVIIPCFKDGNYSLGILRGVKNMGGVATDNMEIVSRSVAKGDEDSEANIGTIIAVLFWLIFFFVIISSKSGLWKWLFFANASKSFRSTGYRRYTGPSGHPGGFSGSSMPKFTGGGSSSFGSSFHGGGGHFSGGGASGHW